MNQQPTAILGTNAVLAVLIGGAVDPALRDNSAGSVMMSEQWYAGCCRAFNFAKYTYPWLEWRSNLGLQSICSRRTYNAQGHQDDR